MNTLRLTEFGAAQPLAEQLAELIGAELGTAAAIVVKAGERLRTQHRMKESPLRPLNGSYRAENVAGVISLHENVDLQIVPKYASVDDGWAEDLLFLSLFAAYGRLDPLNRIAADLGEGNNLAELLGRLLLDLISANDRFALHRRQRIQYTSFDLDGDFDPVELTTSDEDGWKQTGYRFTTNNVYAATISEACRLLIDHVRDATTRNLLRSRVQRFGAQTNRPIVDAQRLPARFARWQEAFDLAQAVLTGAGLRSGEGVLRTLGFTISTWRTWETLIERSLVIALGASDVRLQPRCRLGSFKRGSGSRDVFVQPDAIVTSKDERLIVDAKYKGRAGDDGSAISVGDRYEVLAFMHAAEIDQAILLYPATKDPGSCGEWSMTETLDLPIGTVRAYSIAVAGISSVDGFTSFTNGLRSIVNAERKQIDADHLERSVSADL